MEIKINREIRDYKENIFFGLSLRQPCVLLYSQQQRAALKKQGQTE